MMSCSTSKSWSLLASKTKEAAAVMREGRARLSTPATATRRMSTLGMALFLLLVSSGLSWPQMVSSAPTPQENDVVASAGRKDDGWNTTHQPPVIRAQRQNPIGFNEPLAMMDNINRMFSALLGDGSSTASSPISARAITTPAQEEDERNLVFNMVIQKERTEKSAFIAPDVNWLRDLVPKVVDVVDKPETTIKEIISNAMSEDNIQAEPMRDRQLFVNVVKSQIGSENDVPHILASLANLMKTGGPEVESKLLESRDIGEAQTRVYVINIIIFNLVVLEAPVDKPILVTDKVISHIATDVNEDSYIVALRESQKNRFGSPFVSSGRNRSPAVSSQQHPRTPDKGVIEEDSYIVALKESQKDRFKGTPLSAGHHHEETKHHHHHHHAVDKVATQQFFTDGPAYGYVSTARPLMAMEKDYLWRQTLKPAQQQLAEAVDEEEPLADEEEQQLYYDGQQQQSQTTQSTVIVDPYGSLEFVNLPTGPYFTKPNYAQIVAAETTTSSIEKPPQIEAVVADAAGTGGVGGHQVATVTTTTTAKPVAKKPLIVRVPEAVGVMTNKATNVVRNRIRTVGMLGIPMMVGLAGTVNSWLPAVAAFGRRRRRRSITDEEEEEVNNWEEMSNRKMSSDDDDRSRAIGNNAQILARLMGRGAESLLTSWKNRERRVKALLPSQSTADDANKSAKKKRPLWFRRSPPAVNKGSRTSKKMRNFLSTSRKYVTPLIYATLFGNEKPTDADNRNSAADDDVMEHRGDMAIDPETSSQEAVVEYDLEQQEASENETVDSTAPTDDDQPEVKEMEEPKSEENMPGSLTFLSQSGSDFDIVSNFVRAMMTNHQNENEDDDLAENREEIFWVKGASIVNTTQTVNHKHSGKPNKPGSGGSSLLLLKPGVWVPSSGFNNKNVSFFSSVNSVKKPSSNNNNNNNENVTNSPITYVSIKSPNKVTWLGVGPPDAITSTSPSSAEYDDPVEVMDTIDLPPSEIVGAPLEFYDEETDNYVSKEVPGVPGQPTVPYYTDRPPMSTAEPPMLPLGDPDAQPVRPMRPTDLRPGLSSLLLTIASFNRPRLPPPIDVYSSVSSQDQENVTPPNEEFRDDTTNKYSPGHGIVTPSDETLKYTHGHGIIVTNPPPYDSNQLTAESSLLSSSSNSFLNPNLLPGLIKVTTGSSQQSDEDGEWDESASPSLLGDTSVQFVGMYGGTVVNSTNGPLEMIDIPVSDGMESSLDDVITQLKANLTTGLMTDRPAGGLHFVNTSTDIVIINPFVTPSSMFPPPQVEAVEAEEDDTAVDGAIEDEEADNAIVVTAVAGNQPDSVPVVSELANLFFGSSGGGSSSSGSLVTSGGVSSGGISGGSVSSTTTNPLALLYTYGLAAIGIFALTLPIWIPFVIGKKKRRTYAPSKTYPASKKKTPTTLKKTYGEPPPNHYKDLSEEEMYGNDPYLDQQHQRATAHQQIQPQQHLTTTIDDYFRPSEEIRNSDYSLPKSDDHYMFQDSIALNPQDDMFNNPGPLGSEALYGSPARIFLKARRRRSSARFRPSNNKRSND